MAFDVVGSAKIQTDDGCLVSGIFQFTGQTAKATFDQVLPAGTFDFVSHLANFPVGLKGILIVSFDSDFTLSLDGTNFSTRKYKMFMVQVNDVGVQALKITLSAQSRVQFIAVGS